MVVSTQSHIVITTIVGTGLVEELLMPDYVLFPR